MKHPKILTLALAAGLVAGLAGCTPASTDTEPSVSPTTASPSAPAPSSTDNSSGGESSDAHGQVTEDPAKVELAKQAATIMTTWDPTKDFNRTAAELRARKLMTPERAKEVIAPERPATGVEWLSAAEKNATSQPTVKLMSEHHEQNTIAVTATWQWVAKDGESWAGDGKQTFFFTFTDTKPYKIRDYVSTVR
ncbi:hypothetical protein ACF046_13970 [Glutamicibacter creatinolyticus]|uniref:hypothetical protein n=1 Tax=Glutamicibacter creatinolyticus TaxID=162496 RepID=UPI0031D983A5